MDENIAQVGFLLSVITIVILLLVLLLVNLMLTSRNRKLKHHAEMLGVQSKLREEVAAIRMEVAEATLSDVSRDLHDEVGQLLTFSILQLGNMEDSPEPTRKQMLEEVKQSIHDSLDSIRSIARGLNPDLINQQGLAASLEQLLERAALRTGKKFHLHTTPGFIIHNTSNPIIVFRIIRECVTNALRHGHADEIRIELNSNNNIASITISDNGKGMFSNDKTDGQGFKTMKHYAKLMNGDLNFESTPGKGTKIILTFPNTSF